MAAEGAQADVAAQAAQPAVVQLCVADRQVLDALLHEAQWTGKRVSCLESRLVPGLQEKNRNYSKKRKEKKRKEHKKKKRKERNRKRQRKEKKAEKKRKAKKKKERKEKQRTEKKKRRKEKKKPSPKARTDVPEDEYCSVSADRERHRQQAEGESSEAARAERFSQFLQSLRQAGPPFSWLLLCLR